MNPNKKTYDHTTDLDECQDGEIETIDSAFDEIYDELLEKEFDEWQKVQERFG